MFPQVRAAGVLVVRGEPVDSFLLMKHRDRLDLPKGHLDPPETDLQCALRELQEETNIGPDDVRLFPDFCFTTQYRVRSRMHGGKLAEKTLVLFLAQLIRPVEIKLTEHPDYGWHPWRPPHRLQSQTIDPLLAAVEKYFRERGGSAAAP